MLEAVISAVISGCVVGLVMALFQKKLDKSVDDAKRVDGLRVKLFIERFNVLQQKTETLEKYAQGLAREMNSMNLKLSNMEIELRHTNQNLSELRDSLKDADYGRVHKK